MLCGNERCFRDQPLCFQFAKRCIQAVNIGQIIVWIVVGGFAGALSL
jgi:hypothetical protein